jgi:transcriptional regulator with XRE-family HTH domain
MSRIVITPAQCRAARALLGLTRAQLSGLAGVPHVAIEDFEAEGTMPSNDYPAALRHALERAGVIFIDQNGGGAGVRLRAAQSDA